tara:strand:- start:32 stop:1777 length:1746 start_codon:yes stop_codon:yes gene_type:complete
MQLRSLLLCFLVFFSTTSVNASNGLDALLAPSGISSADENFTVTGYDESGILHIDIRISEGAKLYRDRIYIEGGKESIHVAPLQLPPGTPFNDPEFGVVDVFKDSVQFSATLSGASAGDAVTLHYQGCTDSICYPPASHTFVLQDSTPASDNQKTAPSPSKPFYEPVEPGYLSDEPLWRTLVTAFLLGLGLAFTPCVFPMYPILSTVVMGGGKKSRKRAFFLSLSYVQGMALTYAVLGLMVALIGLQVQVALQNPWVLAAISGFFVALAFSMFGAFNLQLPQRLQTPLNNANQSIKGGTLHGAFGIGTLSALVASPCTTAPLAGVLMYVVISGEAFNGFVTLYTLSLGMGLPLLLFGVVGSAIMPKSGAWMNIVKHLFGFLSLGMATYFASRFLDHSMSLLISLVLASSVLLYLSIKREALSSTTARGALLFIIVAGAASLSVSTYHVIAKNSTTSTEESSIAFTRIKNKEELNEHLRDAKEAGRIVMLDLYASWCSACITYEKDIFTSPRVIQASSDITMLQVDMSDNTPDNAELQSSLNIVGLPSILFFNGGSEVGSARITGLLSKEDFVERLGEVGQR